MALHPAGLDDLREGEVRTLEVPGPAPFRSVVLVRAGGVTRAYWNLCRHIPVRLEGGRGPLALEAGELVCGTHGAAYDPTSGTCTGGPALGTALLPVGLTREGERLLVDLSPPSW